ncbi:MAG: hypothetical protein HY719_16920, partial [Planctomycetes bacterium]|nr:hypothetical protein [Planctomycetota bacterium]
MRKLLLAITVTTLVVLFGCAAPRAGPTAGELRANAGGVAPREDGETRAPTADEEAPAAVAIYAPRRSAAA